jgi:hypothetical protein
MLNVPISSLKVNVIWKAGSLPAVSPDDPQFTLDLDGLKIVVRVNAKAARKLAAHQGGAVLQGRLVKQDGNLVLLEAGFQYLEQKTETA